LALALGLKDHEDACVVATAVAERCDLIVTRDVRDYRNSPIEVKSPKAALALLDEK
jgi:predicted nucleic acid-binding protein